MPNIYTPCTWNMTAVQLVTPTNSALAGINALQAMFNSSTHWTVNSTGTTTTGYKYIEVKPSNLTSVYKDYRILFVERVNTSTNKVTDGTTSPWNSANNIVAFFAPDGGSSWSTFTPANIETGNPPYVGTRYRNGTTAATTYRWMTIEGVWTAFWMYECEGAMWIVRRNSATAHQILGVGAIFVCPTTTLVDYNEAGTEIMLPGMYQNRPNLTSTQINDMWNATTPVGIIRFWWQSAVATKSLATCTSVATNTSVSNTSNNFVWYNTTSGTATFTPIAIGMSSTTPATTLVARGLFNAMNFQTRTTIQGGSPLATIGYTWYPDDTATATASYDLAFMNVP